MKKLIASLSIIYIIFSFSAEAKKIKLYETFVKTISGEKFSGLLYEVTDSTIVLANFSRKETTEILREKLKNGDFTKVVFHFDDVKHFYLKKLHRRNFGKVLGGGVLTFTALGILVYANLPPPNPAMCGCGFPNEFSLFIFPILGAIVSFPIAIIAELIPNSYEKIDGNFYNFREAQFKIMKYSFVEKIKKQNL